MAEQTVTVYPNQAVSNASAEPQQQPAEQQQPLPGSRTIPPPPSGRQSLHRVRMGQFLAERQAAAEAAQAQQAQQQAARVLVNSPEQQNTGQSNENYEQRISDLERYIVAQHQAGQSQEYQSQDTEQYLDPYDPQQLTTLIRREIKGEIDPFRETLRSAEWNRQYNSVLANNGDDPAFKETMHAALEIVGQTGGEVSIPDAYAHVKKESAAQAKANQVQVEQELPETLRRPRRIGDVRFGEIIRHNAETGRARPTGSKQRIM